MTKLELLEADLIRDEGEVLHAYEDSLGFLTIGVGHLIDQRRGGGIPQHVSRLLLEEDIAAVITDLRSFDWWQDLDPSGRRAVANARFVLGHGGFRGFPGFLKALDSGDRVKAGDHLLNSKWGLEQAPARVQRIARLLKTGDA